MSQDLVVSTQRLTKQFADTIAVNEVDLHIRSGEIYGLIGPNGAGKTTLIRLLAAADSPTAGAISIRGQRLIPGKRNREIKRQIGFLPDDFPLYDDLTVRDYLDYFARLYYLVEPDLSQRIDEVLGLVSLENKRDSLISTLSRGMRQRLSLARSVIHRPSLLLLDEPVSGLDPLARIQVRNVIKGFQQQGITILISSHILSDLEDFCTSIGIMEQGRLVESSQLQDLYQRSGSQRVLIAALADREQVLAVLQESPWAIASGVIPEGRQVWVEMSGREEDAAALLRSLIEAGIPVTEFYKTRDSLESIFLNMGYQQTS